MHNWYKISQSQSQSINQDIFAKFEDLKKREIELKVDVTEVSTIYNSLHDKDKDKANEYYDINVAPPRKAYRQIQKELENETKRLISMGLLSFDDAKEKGYYSGGHESNGWKPLPQQLYHVTTAKTEVIQNGLKHRDEIGQDMGIGLGGGESNTISFTTDPSDCYAILISLKEMQKIQKGEMTFNDMVTIAKTGTGADRPFYNEFIEYCSKTFDMKARETDETSTYGDMGSPPDDKYNWQPVLETVWGHEPDKYSRWKRKQTPAEIADSNARLYNAFGMFREQAGGIIYPMFFMADNTKLVEIPESEIAILEFRPKPNAMGYQLSALGEWRTGTGQNVDFVREVNPLEIISSSNFHFKR